MGARTRISARLPPEFFDYFDEPGDPTGRALRRSVVHTIAHPPVPFGVAPRLAMSTWPQGAPTGGGEWPACIAAIARDQDKEAFALLFRYFAPRVKSYLMRFHMEPSVAEDLAQETLLTVWRKAAYFDPARASASTWIFTIARNLRVDVLRGTAHPEALSEDAGIESTAPLPHDIVLSAEREAKTREALVSLPNDQAEVVRLSFFEDKPHSLIAQELGIPLGTVKSRLRLAFQRLKSALEGVS